MKDPVMKSLPRTHYVYPIEVTFDPKMDKKTEKDKDGKPKAPGNVAGSAAPTPLLFNYPSKGKRGMGQKFF